MDNLHISSPDEANSSQGKKGKKPAFMCFKCSIACKASDLKCDYCSKYCHLSCCGRTLKGAKLEAVVDLLHVVGYTRGICKTLIKNLLMSGPDQGSTQKHEEKMDKLAKEVDEIKAQAKLIESLGSESVLLGASGGHDTAHGSGVWSEMKKSISK